MKTRFGWIVIIVVLLIVACQAGAPSSGGTTAEEGVFEVDVTSIPYNDWGPVSAAITFPADGTAQVSLSLSPSDFGAIETTTFSVDGKKGEVKTINTQVKSGKTGFFQVVGYLQINDRQFYDSVTIKMTEQGGTPVPDDTPIQETAPAIEPTVQVPPF